MQERVKGEREEFMEDAWLAEWLLLFARRAWLAGLGKIAIL